MDKLRGLIIAASFLALFLALFFFVQFTGFLFTIQQQYADSPAWLIALYIGGVAVIALVGLIMIYRLSQLGKQPQQPVAEKKREVLDDSSFKEKVDYLQSKGADTLDIEADWKNLLSIREQAAVTIALFGEVNAGKSALIKAFTGQDTGVSARGGKTQTITAYPLNYNGRRYELIDMPGLNEMGETQVTESLVREKAIKSHVVVWLLDEEITQSSFDHFTYLQSFDKPLIIAINKADYYSDSERLQIGQRLQSQLNNGLPIVWVSAARSKIVEKHFDDGRVESQTVEIPADLTALITAIEAITFDRLTLDNRLNDSYFRQLELDMAQSLSTARRTRAEKIVTAYSQKAIFGGLAAVGPGTDVLVQGYLGMGMAKALCRLYDVDIKSVDLEGTMAQLNDKMKKEMAMVLALTGNVLKAFPGIGTVTGGIAHAIAYGLIFESVGRALTACLDKYHGIEPAQLETELDTELHSNIEARAARIAKAIIFKS